MSRTPFWAWILIVIPAIALIYAVTAWVFLWAWNLIIPALFHGPVMDFGQAIVSIILLSIVGSFFRAAGSAQ